MSGVRKLSLFRGACFVYSYMHVWLSRIFPNNERTRSLLPRAHRFHTRNVPVSDGTFLLLLSHTDPTPEGSFSGQEAQPQDPLTTPPESVPGVWPAEEMQKVLVSFRQTL